MAKQLLLSIGIIFRDNIRSIERCLSALQPLRDAVPCELILADTGSADGSREIAERYGDIVFDFPWINDFAAARNAVLDKARGRWFFTVDTDEYLDANVSFLTDFLKNDAAGRYKRAPDMCSVLVRNYKTWDMDGRYTDFMAMRLVRMSRNIRYEGAIHETWNVGSVRVVASMPSVILHHDGYVDMTAKAKRNLPMLRERAINAPDNLIAWLQYEESGIYEPDFHEIMIKTVSLVERKVDYWEQIGPSVMSDAVANAFTQDWPEFWDWVRLAEERFPDSPYNTMDVACHAAMKKCNEQNYEDCIRYSESFLAAVEQYVQGKFDPSLLIYSSLRTGNNYWKETISCTLACVYAMTNRQDEAWKTALKLDFHNLSGEHLKLAAQMIQALHNRTDRDTSPLILAYWTEFINRSPEKAGEWRDMLGKVAAPLFTCAAWENDKRFGRPQGAVYLPLAGEFWAGDAAALLMSDVVDGIVLEPDDLVQLPAMALLHAWEIGVPLPETTLERMDAAAAKMAKEPQKLLSMVTGGSGLCRNTPHVLCWARGILLAALRVCTWEEEEQSMTLVQRFVQAEREFLPLCYAPSALKEENLFLLPPMHRFGWYCVQAFEALDAGNTAGYVQLLRRGLVSCEGMKSMVEFLIGHTPELQSPPPSGELLVLADQIRAVLSKFAPDDPAVAALKQSEAYQKVAYLIDGTPAEAWGGLPQ